MQSLKPEEAAERLHVSMERWGRRGLGEIEFPEDRIRFVLHLQHLPLAKHLKRTS
jgi:hypothetical protein